MIRYHGTPITPTEAAVRVLRGRHAFVSFFAPESLATVCEFCQSFALDNGAFSVWKREAEPNWPKYYDWVADVARRPNCDFAIIPDVIDGTEEENDALVEEWPHGIDLGVPVFHLHESLARLRRLTIDWPRIALGSSGHYDTPGTDQWWMRMSQIMEEICDRDGYPLVKLHGLRMLNPSIFGHAPLSSADSTHMAQKMGTPWSGQYAPRTKATKGIVMAERVELAPTALQWKGYKQEVLW